MRVDLGTLGPLWGRFGVALAEVSKYIYSVCRKYTFPLWILIILCHYKVEQVDGCGAIQGALGGRFGVTLRIFESIWVCRLPPGCVGNLLTRFQKSFIFPIDFNVLMEL